MVATGRTAYPARALGTTGNLSVEPAFNALNHGRDRCRRFRPIRLSKQAPFTIASWYFWPGKGIRQPLPPSCSNMIAAYTAWSVAWSRCAKFGAGGAEAGDSHAGAINLRQRA